MIQNKICPQIFFHQLFLLPNTYLSSLKKEEEDEKKKEEEEGEEGQEEKKEQEEKEEEQEEEDLNTLKERYCVSLAGQGTKWRCST